MKKFLILIISLSFCLSGCNNNKVENTTQENTLYNYIASRTTIDEEPIASPETNIASFSTKIYIKDSSRQNNISITCSKLNGTIVKSRRNFFIL